MDDNDLFSIKKKRFRVRRADLIKAIKTFVDKTPERKDRFLENYDEWTKKQRLQGYSKYTVTRMFGSWQDALKEAGVIGWTIKDSYSDDELLEYFEKLWRWKEECPTGGRRFKSSRPDH